MTTYAGQSASSDYRCLHPFPHTSTASAGGDGIARVWALALDDLLAIASEEVTRSLLAKSVANTFISIRARRDLPDKTTAPPADQVGGYD